MSFIKNTLIAALCAGYALIGNAYANGSSDGGSAQIINGTVAPAGKWPSQVALLYTNAGSNYASFFCGGSLIANNFVLTAAHCITGDDGRVVAPSSIKILYGTQSLVSGGKTYAVSKIFRHPKYNTTTIDYDVAVIKLTKNVTNPKLVTLIDPMDEADIASAGDPAYVVGWGNTSTTKPAKMPKQLMQLKAPIIAKSVCNGPSAYDGQLTSRMICAGYMAGGKDACQGDSGGPLLVPDDNGRYTIQAGVVSFGDKCAQKNSPGIYTRLSYAAINDWVLSKIGF
ncbi:serine protease [Oryzibacter oryziterrae]|uniref:serine protease n=1 Tax=Oryzibacter oryziterrae TaxID=2766474 RepID=UPI001F39E5A4|nr:serine protease [Oryzibacter oryziterrae]